MYYKIIMEQGHMGAGKSFEMVRYLEADGLETLINRLRYFPASKAKGAGKSLKLLKSITREEFLMGKRKRMS